MSLSGSSTAEIHAPLDQVWALVQDVESAPDWQGGLNSLRALDRDDDGRPVRCETETDAKVKSVKSIVRFTYDGPERLTWTQEKGDLNRSTAAGSSRTSATSAPARPTRSTSISAGRSGCSFAARSSTCCATCSPAPAPASSRRRSKSGPRASG